MCLHFSYPDSIRTRARRFLRCIPSQVCFEPLTRTSKGSGGEEPNQATARFSAASHCRLLALLATLLLRLCITDYVHGPEFLSVLPAQDEALV
jgi:hypothetical protein